MLVNEIEILIQNAYSAGQLFLLNASTESCIRLEDALTRIAHAVTSVDPVGRLNLNAINATDFFQQCRQLLTHLSTTPSTRSKLRVVLFNICLYNVPIRRYLAGELQLCGPVFECLKMSISEQLGPQNLIDNLRLLQVLTYEKSLVLGNWTNELISFLIAEITKQQEPEWIPYCMAILSNLVSRSKTLCNRLKKSSTLKMLCRRLLDLLQNNSRTVVVCSLVLIGYLDEKTRDTVFSPQNIAQAFLCIFNVLGSGDSLMTIHIAVDLLRRLVISHPTTPFGTPNLTSTAKNFASYSFFEKAIQRVANLLVTLDMRTEESWKIYELFLSFCKVNELRAPICRAVIQIPITETRLTTPCLSMCRVAQMSFESAFRPEIPLNAIKLLIFMIREAIESGIRVQEIVPIDMITSLIELNIKSVIETKSDWVSFQCSRITEGLRLAEAVSSDEEVRSELLMVVNAPLCAHINESQLISNPIVNFVTLLNTSSSSSGSSNSSRMNLHQLPSWSMSGLAIPLQLLRLLASLKDHSKMHKDLYWKSLKDERLVPFIAFAIACGGDSMVKDALILYTHCAQVQEFPTTLLSNLIANCTMEQKRSPNSENELSSSINPLFPSQNGHMFSSENSLDMAVLAELPATNGEAFKELDDLIERIKNGLDLKDLRTSHLVGAFERKVAMLENRARELEQLMAVKEQALSQSERLRASSLRDRGNSPELSNLRLILTDLEKKLKICEEEIVSLNNAKWQLNEKCEQISANANDEMGRLKSEFQREKSVLLNENEKERELHNILRQRFDEMTKKFDQATTSIFEKQQELEKSKKFGLETAKLANETQMALEKAQQELIEAKNINEQKQKEMDDLRKTIDQFKEENLGLKNFKEKFNFMVSQLNSS